MALCLALALLPLPLGERRSGNPPQQHVTAPFVLGAARCPQVIHNLCTRGERSRPENGRQAFPSRLQAPPEPADHTGNGLTVAND